MEQVAPLGPVYQAGTLSANPIGMRAGLATLSKMEAVNGWTTLNARTATFASDLRADFDRAGLPIDVITRASIFWLRPKTAEMVRRVDEIPAAQSAWFRKVFHAALARQVYLPPSGFEVCFLSMAHDEATLSEARAAIVAAVEEAGQP